HADDLTEYRPGRAALIELGIISPFSLAGIGKAEIYALAKELGVPVTPPSSCLATRIPFGDEVTIEKLNKIAAAEDYLRNKGITGILRVRLVFRGAVVETEKHVMERAELYKDDLKIFGFSTIQVIEYTCGGTNSWNKTEQ
ncbi:MAG: TIGR00268 family protein, partial [Methanocorpusculum sp.]|nr:TIGR00268 family protein [Methanocorpusculum sp.]